MTGFDGHGRASGGNHRPPAPFGLLTCWTPMNANKKESAGFTSPDLMMAFTCTCANIVPKRMQVAPTWVSPLSVADMLWMNEMVYLGKRKENHHHRGVVQLIYLWRFFNEIWMSASGSGGRYGWAKKREEDSLCIGDGLPSVGYSVGCSVLCIIYQEFSILSFLPFSLSVPSHLLDWTKQVNKPEWQSQDP